MKGTSRLSNKLERISAALIGTGHIAREHLACLKQLPGAEVVAVCDKSAVLAELTADEFGIPASFSDHKQMLDVIRPEIVHITTPAASHFPIALDALSVGAHLLVEKPITLR